MTGTTAQQFTAAAAAAGNAVPALVYTPGSGGNSAAAVGGDQFAIPYNSQFGPTKYAPMQSVPPTKITKGGNPTPLYPTSAFTIATTWLLPNPSIKTTTTQQQTASFDSIENPVSLSQVSRLDVSI